MSARATAPSRSGSAQPFPTTEEYLLYDSGTFLRQVGLA
jgi:hypothetical protein